MLDQCHAFVLPCHCYGVNLHHVFQATLDSLIGLGELSSLADFRTACGDRGCDLLTLQSIKAMPPMILQIAQDQICPIGMTLKGVLSQSLVVATVNPVYQRGSVPMAVDSCLAPSVRYCVQSILMCTWSWRSPRQASETSKNETRTLTARCTNHGFGSKVGYRIAHHLALVIFAKINNRLRHHSLSVASFAPRRPNSTAGSV